MKKRIAILMMLVMLFSVPAFGAATGTDAVSAASKWVEEAPVKTTSTPVKVTAAPAVTGNETLYTVMSGDMMWKIAAKYKMSLAELIALNPQVKNPSMLQVGQQLVVKAGASMPATMAATGSVKVYEGFGTKVNFRNGPGTDSEGAPVYSFNIAMARATFDSQGRILNVFIDGYEVSSPNYDGASMPHFSGWPEQPGTNVTDHTTEKVVGKSVNTLESATAEVNGWVSKRERGDTYHMNAANEWYKQMDFYQKFFVGKTVAELEDWFSKYTTTAGRPIKANTTNETDLAKYNKLSDTEKAALADVVSGATMSLRDAHGDFLGAVVEAYNNRVEVTVPTN